MSDAVTVLVVDDETNNIRILSSLLKDFFKVKIAKSGEKALQIAQKSPIPQVIFLDIFMPGLDGYQVCEILKKDDLTKDIEISFVTSNDSQDEKQKGLDLGAFDYLIKPIQPCQLSQCLKSLFPQRSFTTDMVCIK
ncbi:response regulator [bacterium]|nr:response regulator [bacterium]